MVLIVDGNSEIGAHVIRLLIRSRAIIFLQEGLFTFIRAQRVTILYNYHGLDSHRQIYLLDLLYARERERGATDGYS